MPCLCIWLHFEARYHFSNQVVAKNSLNDGKDEVAGQYLI